MPTVEYPPFLNGRGWLYPARLNSGEHELFARFVDAAKFIPGCYLETGVAYGGSMILAGIWSEKYLVGIDPMQWSPSDKTSPYYISEADRGGGLESFIWENIHAADISPGRVLLIQRSSAEALASWTEPISILFLDSGLHEYDLVSLETKFIEYLSPGGVVMFHNSDLHGVKKAMLEAMDGYGLTCLGSVGLLTVFAKLTPGYSLWNGYIVSFQRLFEAVKDLPIQNARPEDLPLDKLLAHQAFEVMSRAGMLGNAQISMRADTRYPIVLGNGGFMWDGAHRLVKAIMHGESIRYVVWDRGEEFGPSMLGWLTGEIND